MLYANLCYMRTHVIYEPMLYTNSYCMQTINCKLCTISSSTKLQIMILRTMNCDLCYIVRALLYCEPYDIVYCECVKNYMLEL